MTRMKRRRLGQLLVTIHENTTLTDRLMAYKNNNLHIFGGDMHTNGCYDFTNAHGTIECRKLRAVSAFPMLLRCINAEQWSSEVILQPPVALLTYQWSCTTPLGPQEGATSQEHRASRSIARRDQSLLRDWRSGGERCRRSRLCHINNW